VIFLTVGTQLPFDRLTRAVDDWCAAHPDIPIFGQIADPGEGGYRPQHFEWQAFVEPAEFDRRFEEAPLIIAHAGMGSIITALTLAKPVPIMPRRADLREQRNDHQLATAAQFEHRPGVWVAPDEAAIGPLLDQVLDGLRNTSPPGTPGGVSPYASPQLIEAIRSFIHSA
jgi:UDP-N-acetylglucosamine transferase subunit ALG13